MKHRAAIAWLLAAGGLFTSALVAKDEVLLLLSIGAGIVGVTLVFPTALKLLSRVEDDSHVERRLEELERRLKVAETELESATSEVVRLKEEREFDRLLSPANRTRSPES